MAMTVEALRCYLSVMRGDDVVIIAKGAEGNAFSPLIEVDEAFYIADSSYSGEIDVSGDEGVRAVVLWPVN